MLFDVAAGQGRGLSPFLLYDADRISAIIRGLAASDRLQQRNGLGKCEDGCRRGFCNIQRQKGPYKGAQ